MTSLKDLLGYDFPESGGKSEGFGKVIEFMNQEIFLSQYRALEEVLAQFGKVPEEMAEDMVGNEDRIQIEQGKITSITLYMYNIQTPDKKLTIPPTLTQLEYLLCDYTWLQQLNIPPTLTKLKRIYCSDNYLQELTIPETLAQLARIYCPNNQLTQINIPDTLTQLAILECSGNPNLKQLTIPYNKGMVVCCKDTSIPQERMDEITSRGVNVVL